MAEANPRLWRLLLCLVALSPVILAQQPLILTVDRDAGNDTTCLSAQELMNSTLSQSDDIKPCRTINKALGNVQCNYSCENDAQQINNVTIRLENGVHRLEECVGILHSSGVHFEAVNPGMATIICQSFPNAIEDNYDNLFACRSSGISFEGIRFEECGPTSPNVFLNYTSEVTFRNCVFYNNSGASLQVQFTTAIKLIDTEFLENKNQLEARPDENETSIEDLYNSITTSGGFTYFSRDDGGDLDGNPISILIQNCTFRGNSANRNDPNNTRPVLLKANGHGGAILIRLAGVNNSEITIIDSTFENNVAQVDGGAVYVTISEGLSSNTINFINNRFINNSVEQASGGAVSVNSFMFSYNNTIIVEDCVFMENSGNAGGAFSVALYDSNLESTQHPDAVNFSNCTFTDNAAQNEGTAVGLFSLVHVDQVGFPVTFDNCIFVNNTSTEETEDTSAIAAFRFPTIFSGTNDFILNTGGGITLLNTRMQASGALLFLNNTAVFGGGIAMDDRCLLEISPGINMSFIGNTAGESGGGIYVEFPPIRFVVDIFNRLCFLQYNDGSGSDVPPQEWENVSISFVDNTARLSGAAIYASDMQQCGWLGNYTTSTSLIFDPPEELAKLSPFYYSGNTLLPEGLNVSILNNIVLATAPSRVHNSVLYSLVQPGESLPINLLATDQVNNSREAVWSLEAPSQNANLDALSANNDTYVYEVPDASKLGIEGMITEGFATQFTLNFSLLRTLGFISSLNLTVNGCHPGFNLVTDNEGKGGMCQCDTDNSNILRCDENNRYLYLREGIWGGVEDSPRALITERVQPGYVECQTQGRLPGCLFRFDNPDDQCRDGRRGPLCGTCVEDHGVTLDLLDCTKTSCDIGLSLFIILCISVVVVSFLMLFFNVDLPNELKGFIFYAQVIGLVYRPYIVVQSSSSSTDPLSILVNLLGFSVPIPLCLHVDLRAHHVALLGYISPILALLTELLYVVGARYCKPLANRSALKGITFLSVFIYKYIADTAFIFISCLSTDFGFVFQYDGSLECGGAEFVIFLIIGFLLVFFFVMPAPFAVGYVCIRRPQRFQQYADVLTKGLKQKHRWWGGWDIGRRLPFVFIGYFIVLARPSLVLFFMSLAALFVLVLHLFVKPYENMYINIIETAILLNLLMVTAAFLDPSNSPVPEWFSTMLVLLPYIYAVGYISWRLAQYLWRRFGPYIMKAMKEDSEDAAAQTDGTTSTRHKDSRGSAVSMTETTGEIDTTGSEASGNKSQPVSSVKGSGPAVFPGEDEEAFAVLREPLLDM